MMFVRSQIRDYDREPCCCDGSQGGSGLPEAFRCEQPVQVQPATHDSVSGSPDSATPFRVNTLTGDVLGPGCLRQGEGIHFRARLQEAKGVIAPAQDFVGSRENDVVAHSRRHRLGVPGRNVSSTTASGRNLTPFSVRVSGKPDRMSMVRHALLMRV